MMEALFSILITRFYGQNEDIFYLPKNIPIKVEIPNTFINFLEKFPILNLFKIKELTIKNLAPLIVPKDIKCNIEVVANYLKCLKEDKIKWYDLVIPGITPEEFETRRLKRNIKGQGIQSISTCLKSILLPSEECQKLILEKINIV
jgi:hypothetical protein